MLDFSPLCVVQQSGGVPAGGNWLIGRPGASTSPPPAPLPASCGSEKLNLSWLSVSLYPSILYPIHWLAMSRVFLKICGTQKIWFCACNLCVFAHEDGTCEVMKFITDAAVHACESLELCKIYFMLRCHDFVWPAICHCTHLGNPSRVFRIFGTLNVEEVYMWVWVCFWIFNWTVAKLIKMLSRSTCEFEIGNPSHVFRILGLSLRRSGLKSLVSWCFSFNEGTEG